MIEFSAALLCGGESSRMGRDKATLRWKGRPLWQIQLEKLRSLRPAELLISARVDPSWRPADCLFVGDRPPSRGPLSGLAAALRQCRASPLLVLAIDLPNLKADDLRRTLYSADGEVGCVPLFQDRAEPLAAVYSKSALALAEAAVEHGNYSLQTLVRTLIAANRLRTLPLAASEAVCYTNLNSPDDLPDDECH